jgi:hypothetical protein
VVLRGDEDECGQSYHHSDLKVDRENARARVANGVQLLKHGQPTRKVHSRVVSWMTRSGPWVDQCTWRHLLVNLPKL